MKQSDILAETLVNIHNEGDFNWPDGYDKISVNDSGELWAFSSTQHVEPNKLSIVSSLRCSVHRDQYEAALAASKEMLINKPDADGWIAWGGGECPVEDDELVEVRYRDGTIRDAYPAVGYIWTNGYHDLETTDSDIIAYRLHKPEPHQPVWNGEGLPPVGCECEWQDKNTKKWSKFSVVFSSEWVTVIRENKTVDPVDIAIENYGDESRRQFRPIRTEAERKRDEAVKELHELYHRLPPGSSVMDYCEAIYESIAEGRITVEKLPD